MGTGDFPHHSGGVIQVQHTSRYGAVPESLLEDPRLALDSRAVAAWLAIKPSGWQICIRYLRKQLARPGKEFLGKDLWQRIAKELEAAGYLSRRTVHGPAGQWEWHIVFNPVPVIPTVGGSTVAGLAGYGSAVHGSSGDGFAGDAQHGYKEVPSLKIPRMNTTTYNTRASAPKKKRIDGHIVEAVDVAKLHYPKVTENELMQLKQLVADCKINVWQDVLDEIEGIRQEGRITRGVVSLAKGLIRKVANRDFMLSAGLNVRAQRQKRIGHDLAITVSAAPIQQLLSMSEEDIARLPQNIARRVREQMNRENCSENPVGSASKSQLSDGKTGTEVLDSRM